MNQNKLKSALASQTAEADVVNIDFVDLFDLDEIQKLQDSFADAFGIASIITRPDGTPITRPSRFSQICTEVIHSTSCGRQNCQMLNPVGHIEDLKQLTVRCEACGKWEICVGISIGERLVALWRAGQVRTPETQDGQLLAYAEKIGVDSDAYQKSLDSVPVMSQQTLEKVANVLSHTAKMLANTAFQNFKLNQVHSQKKIEEQLEHANFLSEKAFDLAKAGYWAVSFDNSGYYISNPRTAQIFGDLPKPDWRYHITDEWLVNIGAVDPAIAQNVYQHLNDVIEGRIQTYDAIYPYKRPVDGDVVWIHATANLARDENQQPLEMYGVVQDITAQILGEKALKESQQRLDLALKGAWLGLWDWQPDSGELITSQIWAEMLGYSAEELDSLYPKNFERWQKLLHPDDLQRIWQDVQDHIDGKNPSYRAEFRLKTRSGKW
ncbi:MAG: multi-sensor hybrid histidine kinase, partial [uncultured bacterium]